MCIIESLLLAFTVLHGYLRRENNPTRKSPCLVAAPNQALAVVAEDVWRDQQETRMGLNVVEEMVISIYECSTCVLTLSVIKGEPGELNDFLS